MTNVHVNEKEISINEEEVFSILGKIDNSIQNKIFFIDHNTWTIYMAQEDGTIIDKKGGVGKGPGEFALINDIHTYTDEELLQVFDKKLQRITYYSIKEEELILSHIVQLPNYGQFYLQSFFRYSGENFGVFKVLRQYGSEKIENKIYLYQMDEGFEMRERVLEIDGNELILTIDDDGAKRFRENIFGDKTTWYFDDNKFIYSRSNDFKFNFLDLKKNAISEYEITDIPKIRNVDEIIQFMEDKYSMMFTIVPEYESYFKDRKVVPYFSSMYSYGNFIFIPIKNYGEDNSYILQYRIDSKETKKIKVPSNFIMKGANADGIFGVNIEDKYGSLTISVFTY